MTKDNLLFALIGIVLGLISGFFLQQVISERQPPRRIAGQALPGAASEDAAMATAPGGDGEAAMAAIQQLRRQVEANPDDADAVLALANMNYDIQNWQRARELYEHYLELRPSDANVMTDLGIVYRNLGDATRALELFRRAKATDVAHWQSRFNEAIVLALDLRQFDQAETVLAELDRLQPGNPDVVRLKAEIARVRGAA